MLENVCRKLEREFPEVPYFTIHDSIITTKDELNLVKSFAHYTINKITKKSVGLKIKSLDSVPEITEDLIQELFNKIRIKSPDDFEIKRYTFFLKNIETGTKILD